MATIHGAIPRLSTASGSPDTRWFSRTDRRCRSCLGANETIIGSLPTLLVLLGMGQAARFLGDLREMVSAADLVH